MVKTSRIETRMWDSLNWRTFFCINFFFFKISIKLLSLQKMRAISNLKIPPAELPRGSTFCCGAITPLFKALMTEIRRQHASSSQPNKTKHVLCGGAVQDPTRFASVFQLRGHAGRCEGRRKSNLVLGPSSNLQHPRWSANNGSLKSQRETMDKKINLTTTWGPEGESHSIGNRRTNTHTLSLTHTHHMFLI